MAKKRIGRPVVEAAPGERAGLSLRVTPEVKARLEKAAAKQGRSLSQEAEFRLERSLFVERHLMLTRGNGWAPVTALRDNLLIHLGSDPGDLTKPEFVVLRISPDGLKALRSFFGGEPYPCDLLADAPADEWKPLDITSEKKREDQKP